MNATIITGIIALLVCFLSTVLITRYFIRKSKRHIDEIFDRHIANLDRFGQDFDRECRVTILKGECDLTDDIAAEYDLDVMEVDWEQTEKMRAYARARKNGSL